MQVVRCSILTFKAMHIRSIIDYTRNQFDSSHQAGVVLSLPIAVDNVEMELTILQGDEPMDVIRAFCKENMPDEGTVCVDQLLLVIQDKLAVAEIPEMLMA